MSTLVLDFETSGLNPYHSDVIEIGAKIMETGETYSSLIRPKSERPISDKISQITGITNREIRRFCRSKGWTLNCWYDGYAEFYFWLLENTGDEVTIVSHNGTTFDFLILKQIIKLLREGGCDTSPWDNKQIYYIDTLLLARRLLINQEYFRQTTLCKRFGIEVIVAHRALADVEALEKLYQKLVYLMKGYTHPEEIIDYINLKD
jgi:DNA polymerase-3 subunit alpha (Gram-positive type)